MAEGLNRWMLSIQESHIDLVMKVGARHEPCGQRWTIDVPQGEVVESRGGDWVMPRVEALARIHTPECDRELVKSWTKK